MDHEAFDRLTVVVGKLRDRASRRDAIRAIAGGALAIAGLREGGEAEARKRKKKKNKHHGRCLGNNQFCDRNSDCCSSNCYAGIVCRGGSGGGSGGCNGRNEFCNRNSDCCSGYCLNNICIGGGGGGGGGCRGQGSGCNRNSDCCSGNCFNNVCFGNGGGGSCQNCGSGFRCCNGACLPSDFTCCRSGSGIGAICPSGMTCCARDTGAGCCANSQICCSGSLGGGCCPAGSRCRSNGTCVFYQTAENGVQTAKVVPQTPRTRDLGQGEPAGRSGDDGQAAGASSPSRSGAKAKK